MRGLVGISSCALSARPYHGQEKTALTVKEKLALLSASPVLQFDTQDLRGQQESLHWIYTRHREHSDFTRPRDAIGTQPLDGPSAWVWFSNADRDRVGTTFPRRERVSAGRNRFVKLDAAHDAD
jgi:hypothetical protein